MELEIIRTPQHDEWLEALHKAYRYDFYHCPSYQVLSAKNSSQEAVLIVCTEGPFTIAIPLMFRPVNEVEGLEEFPFRDATSVYGYVGPVASHENIPQSLIDKFQEILCDFLKEKGIVCVFSRLHPLINQKQLLTGLGDIVYVGETISIDLNSTVEEQWSRYRKDHKRRINRLRRMGFSCLRNSSNEYLDEFIAIYYETMNRVKADDSYYFDARYFRGLVEAHDLGMQLFSVIYEGEIVCSGLFSLCSDIVQAYLGGTKSRFLKYSPDRLIFDEGRIWANAAGANYFHIGGGVGAKEDSLFEFKAGFSRNRHNFYVWRLILDGDIYETLQRKKEQWNRENECLPAPRTFFPRLPVPCITSSKVFCTK